MGHLPSVCRSKNQVKAVAADKEQYEIPENQGNNEENSNDASVTTYSVNLFVIKSSSQQSRKKIKYANRDKNEFKAQVIINNSLISILADTGAKVSVCGTTEAKEWGILDRMSSSKANTDRKLS